VSSFFEQVSVECYAGYRGEETPRAVFLEGRRFEVVCVLSRHRAIDVTGGRVREAWRCRLEDGRDVVVDRLESGTWRARPAI